MKPAMGGSAFGDIQVLETPDIKSRYCQMLHLSPLSRSIPTQSQERRSYLRYVGCKDDTGISERALDLATGWADLT